MNSQGGLTILECRELLGTRNRNRAVAGDDLLDQPSHGFQPQGQRRHVEQQPVLSGVTIARQQVGLQCGAKGHHLVRIQVGQRQLSKK